MSGIKKMLLGSTASGVVTFCSLSRYGSKIVLCTWILMKFYSNHKDPCGSKSTIEHLI